MTTIIKLICHASGVPSPMDGQYLEAFDFEAHDGHGEAAYTPDLARALRFELREAAFAFWKIQSKIRPLRPDGKPNRPLTAATVEIIQLNEDGSLPTSLGTPIGVTPNGVTKFVCPHCAWGTSSPSVLLKHVAEKHQ